MQNTNKIDFKELHAFLLEKGVLPDGYMDIIAKEAQYNIGTVRALLNGNDRVYVSDEAKQRVANAILRILYAMPSKAASATVHLQNMMAEPAK